MCFLSLQFSPRPEPPNRDIAVRSLPYPPQKRRVWEALSGTAGQETAVRSLPYLPPKRRVWEALSGTAGRKHCCSFSPIPTAEAQSMGSVVRNRRTEALLFVLSHTHRRSAGNRGILVRKYRTEALPFGISRGRLRRFKCRRNAGIGEALSGTAVRRQPRPAPPPRPMPPPPNPPPKPPRPPPKPRPPKDDGREPRPCQPRREGCMPPTQPCQNHAPKGV